MNEHPRAPVARWPAPLTARNVAVMGGTFDPVHRGHVALALAARAEMERRTGDREGWLVLIPAARNPLKSAGPVLSDRVRVELLSLALGAGAECGGGGALERVGISTIEIEDADEAAPVSYTVDTLRKLGTMAPNTRFHFIIGADSVRSFHRWRDPRGILALAEPIVLLRAPDQSADDLLAAISSYWSGSELDRWRRAVIHAPLINISSTRVRELLDRGDLDHPELAASLSTFVLERLRADRAE